MQGQVFWDIRLYLQDQEFFFLLLLHLFKILIPAVADVWVKTILLDNAVVWMVSNRPLISKSFSPNLLVTAPKTPSTMV